MCALNQFSSIRRHGRFIHSQVVWNVMYPASAILLINRTLAEINYVLGLVEFLSFNSISNIDTSKNKFYVGNEVIVLLAESYEIEEIEMYLQEALAPKGISLNLKPNNNTLRSVIKFSLYIDF